MKSSRLLILIASLTLFLTPYFSLKAEITCTWRESYSYFDSTTETYIKVGGCNNNEEVGNNCQGKSPSGNYICCCEGTASPATEPNPPKFEIPKLQIPSLGENLTPVTCDIDNEGNYVCPIPWIGQYITAIYNYGIGIAGILAAIVLMAGGVLWLISGGDSSKITQAKELIGGSITGLIVLMTSYVLLIQINPDLVNFKPVTIGAIKGIEAGNEVPQGSSSQFFQCAYNQYGANEQSVKNNLRTVTFLGHEYSVHSKVVPALEAAQQQINNAKITYKSTAGGGFNWRQNVNKPLEQSLHSFGIAIDINPDSNPNYFSKDKPCKTDIPLEIINILKNNGFRWGGDYKTVCDSMHFEWVKGDAPCKL